MNRNIRELVVLLVGAVILSLGGVSLGAETLFANYFDIKTGSPAGTEVTGKVNLLRNKDCPAVPVPADYSFVITSDPSGIFEIVAQRDPDQRLFGALKVKAGQSVASASTDYPLQIELRQGGTVHATAPITVRALPQTQHEQFLAYATTHCRNFDRLFARVRPTDAQVLDWITQVENNNGRFISADVDEPLDFYTRPVGDYQNTVNLPNNLSTQWQRVGANIGGMGFAYTNTDSRYSTSYGPNGTSANRLRLKNALYAAFNAFIDRMPLDPSQSVFNGQPLGDEFGDGVFRLNEKGVTTHTDVSHQWIWVDPVTGPAVWLMPDLIAGIKAEDTASIALHRKLLHYFQLSFGAVKGSYRNLRGSPHVWSGMAPEQVGYTDGAFSDGNLDHRFRNWLTLPTIWIDYNRPATYLQYFYDGYTWPGITPTLVTGPETYRFKPGWAPHGVVEDLGWWARHSYPDTHLYLSEGANPDGSLSHHLRGNLNDITMIAYGHGMIVAPIPSLTMLRDTHIDTGSEAFNRATDLWLYSYDKMIYKGDIDFVTTGINFLSDNTGFVRGIPNSINQLVAARQPGTQVNQLTALQGWGTALQNGTQSVTGDFPFWVNNYHVHRKGGSNTSNDSYFFAVKMGSDRTGTNDDPAGKPFHMGSGTMQTRTGSTEYDVNVRKRLDWHALPGVTEEWRNDAIPTGEITSQVAGSSFAGSASDGVQGFSAMRYRPAAASTYATANADKAWFFPGDFGIALGSGVGRRANSPGQGRPIVTTLDQCRWSGNLTYAVNGNAPVTVANTTNLSQDLTLTAPSWLHQGGVGYLVFPRGNQPLYLRGGASLVDSHADDTSTATLLHLALGHGVDPVASGLTKYFYIVVPNKTAAEMPALLTQMQGQVQVLGNGNGIQGIYDQASESAQVVFHAAGTATFGNGLELTVDRPALVQLRKTGANWQLAASSPIHDFSATAINLTLKVPLKSGSYAHTLPGVIPRAGEEITVTQIPGGVKVRVPLPDVTDGPDLDYQEQLYANVPIRVTIPVNTPPTATADSATTAEDVAKTIDVLANDSVSGGGALTIGELSQGGHGSTAIVNHRVVYTPEADFSGTDTFTYAAFDANDNASGATVTVTVTSVADIPFFASELIVGTVALEEQAYSGSLIGYATDGDAGDTLTYSKVSGPAWLSVAASGALSGTPAHDNLGANGFVIRVTDAAGAIDETSLSIAVTENGDSDGDGFTNVLELNLGTDPYAASSQPHPIYSNLRAWWKLDEFSGTLADDSTGRPQDGILLNSAARVTGITGNGIALNGINQSIQVPALNLNSNTVTLSAWIKRNGTQAPWAGLVFSRGSGTAVSGLSFGPGNDLRYTWNNVSSSYSFASGLIVPENTWTFCALVVEPTKATLYMQPLDGTMQSATNTVAHAAATFSGPLHLGQDAIGAGGRYFKGALDEVRVHTRSLTAAEIDQTYEGELYRPPGFISDPVVKGTATEDAPYTGQTLSGSATDSNLGDALTYSKIDGPAWLNVAANGTLSGTPGNGDVGANAFTVRVTDAGGLSDEAALSITVNNVNDAPSFTANPISRPDATAGAVYGNTLAGSAVDVDAGDSLTYSKVSGPAWLTVAANGALSGTPAGGEVGSNSFTVRATDAAGAYSDAALHLNVVVIYGNGVWNNPAGGSWNIPANWTSGVIAAGVDKVAHLGALDLTANATVILDGAMTLGGLAFGDTTPSHSWTLGAGAGGALTLSSTNGTPGISIANQTTAISAAISGTQGFEKTGSGILLLSGSNTYSGTTRVTQGTLRISHANGLGAASSLAANGTEVSGGASLDLNGIALSPTSGVIEPQISIAGSGMGGNGAVVNQGASQINALRTLKLSADASVGGTGRFDVRNNSPVLDLAGFKLTKVGGNQFSVVGGSVTNGNVDIIAGIFGLETTTTATGSGTITIAATGTFGVYGTKAANITRSVTSNGGTIRNLGSDAAINSPILLNAGTTTLTGTNTTTLGGAISGPGGITKSGTGTFTLVAANTYPGSTSIAAGRLNVNGSLAGGTVLVQNSATLGGSGSIGGATTVQTGGTLAPSGSLMIGNSLALAGSVQIKIGKAGPQTTTDAVVGLSTVTYGGALTVTCAAPAELVAGDVFTMFTAANYAGNFSSITLPPLGGGLLWDTSRLAIDGSISVGSLPLAADDSFTSAEDSNGVFAVLANDTDADGDTLVIESVTQAAHGTVAIVGGNVTYTPAPNWYGSDGFTYTLSDQQDGTSTASVAVTVSAVNDAPVFAVGTMTGSGATEGSAYSGTLIGSASDVDAVDVLAYSKVSGPAWLSVASNGALAGLPAAGDVGSNTWTVRVTDSQGAAATAMLNIGVAALPLPGGWSDSAIGSVGVAGSVLHNNGTYTVKGSGADIWGTADGFHFVSTTLTGDGEIRARVTSQTNPNPWSKAGVMIRETSAAGSKHAMMIVSPGNGFNLQYRAASAGASTSVSGPALNAVPNNWVRLTRSGTLFTAYVSANGSTWTQVGTATISMAATVNVGLTVTSHDNAQLCTATFDNVAVTPFPLPWQVADLGTTGLQGSAEFYNGKFTVKGAGTIGTTADHFRYLYQALSGDGEIVARIPAPGNTGTSARLGVMVRESLTSGSSHAFMGVNGSSAYQWQSRSSTNGMTTTATGGTGTVPNLWVRVVRTGNTLTGYSSANGTAWTQVGSQSITMAANIYIGLAVASGSTSTLNTTTFENTTVVP